MAGISSPLTAAISDWCRSLLCVESHSDAVVTVCWACEAVKTTTCLRTYLPAFFGVQRSIPYTLSNAPDG